MEVSTNPKPKALQFIQLPSYAQYLLTNRLEEFVQAYRELSVEVDLPILRRLKQIPEEQQQIAAMHLITSLLTNLAENNAPKQIHQVLNNWQQNQLPFVDQHEIGYEDVAKISFIRKNVFLKFLPEYCKDTTQILEIISEIDRFVMQYDLAASEVYHKLMQSRLDEHSHFITKINNTLPGAVYIFDINEYRNVYENSKVEEIIGYSAETLNEKGPEAISNFTHPDDQKTLSRHIETMKAAQDGEIISYRYRVKQPDGNYKWIRNYETVFRRDAKGNVTQLICISLDIDKEKRIAEQLKKREEQLLEAQEIARLGSFTWDLKGDQSEISPQLEKIYGAPGADFNSFINNVNPADRHKIEKAIHDSFKTGIYECEYRYLAPDGEKMIWAQGRIDYVDGEPITMTGTAQDITGRQNLIERLRESEKLYKQAQSMAHMGNWSLRLDTNQVVMSDEMYSIYELPRGTAFSADIFISMVHPDDVQETMQTFERTTTTGVPLDKIHRIVMPDGRIKTLHQKAEITDDEKGIKNLVVGSTQDITEQFKVQVELDEKQNFIRKIADATPSIIASYNINTGKYVFVSEGLEKLLGYKPEQVIKEGINFFANIIHPDDFSLIMEKNAKALEEANSDTSGKETIVEFTYRMRHKNGNYRWFHTYGTVFDRNAAGKVEHILNISLDVTDSVEATRKIEEQEYFIQQIADASPTILYLFDVDTNSFAYLNREIFYVLGYSPEEILAMGTDAIINLYHPEDVALLPERKGSTTRFEHKDSMMQYECRLKTKAGEWYWFLVREIVFRKNEKGEVQQLLGAALDINKRKEMERTLLQNSFQLEQSNSSLEEFAYVASHDLKEPLRKISTFGDRMAATQMEKLTDDGRIYLKKIVDASQRMQLMIDDLLSVSMISGNRSFEVHSLQAILDDARQAVEFKIEQKGAIIKSTELPDANIVPSQFRQLFQNLLSNSLKFVREGVQPVITISHQILKPGELTHMQLPKAASYLQLVFEDNGIGFENEFAGKIFQIFHRLHGRSEYEGTGIGLAICKKIVEHHGGVIFANGKPGEGAKFTIILPR